MEADKADPEGGAGILVLVWFQNRKSLAVRSC